MLQKGAGDHLSPQDQASWMSSGPARNVPHRVYFQGQREMAKLFIKNIQRALRRSASGRGMKELRGDIERLEDKLMDMKDRILHDADVV